MKSASQSVNDIYQSHHPNKFNPAIFYLPNVLCNFADPCSLLICIRAFGLVSFVDFQLRDVQMSKLVSLWCLFLPHRIFYHTANIPFLSYCFIWGCMGTGYGFSFYISSEMVLLPLSCLFFLCFWSVGALIAMIVGRWWNEPIFFVLEGWQRIHFLSFVFSWLLVLWLIAFLALNPEALFDWRVMIRWGRVEFFEKIFDLVGVEAPVISVLLIHKNIFRHIINMLRNNIREGSRAFCLRMLSIRSRSDAKNYQHGHIYRRRSPGFGRLGAGCCLRTGRWPPSS